MKQNKIFVLGLVVFGILIYFSMNVFAPCSGSGLTCADITNGVLCGNAPECTWSGSCTGTISIDCDSVPQIGCDPSITSGKCTWSGGGSGNATNISFYGYTYKTNNEPFGGVNVSVEIYVFSQQSGPVLNRVFSEISNASGFFNFTVFGNSSYMYKPVIRHFNGSNVDYMGSSLPQFPYQEFRNMNMPLNFYLQESATINLTVFGEPRRIDPVGTTWNRTLNMTIVSGITTVNGLEWNNETKKWSYLVLADTNSLILLNHDFTFNRSYNINIPDDFLNLKDLDIVNNTWYYIINGQGYLRKYSINETGGLVVNQTFNLSQNYLEADSIEYDYCNDSFYISGINSSGSQTLDKYSYNGTDFLYTAKISILQRGKLERPDCNYWFVTPELSNELLRGDNNFNFNLRWGANFQILGIEQFPGYLDMDGGLYVLSSDNVSGNVSRRIQLYNDGTKNFTYQVKDTKLGYSVSEVNRDEDRVAQATIYLPSDRNYSVMLRPQEAFPFSYELNNISTYPTPKHLDLRLNASESQKWVSGYAAINGTTSFDGFYVIGYIMEPGMMVHTRTMPCNISSWRRDDSGDSLNLSDYFNASNGFYNMTLIGSAEGTNVLLYAVVTKNGTYYGAFRNITLTASSSDTSQFNFSLHSLIGNATKNITCDLFSDQGQSNSRGIITKAVKFRIQDSNGTAPSSAHISAEVDYSLLGSAEFSWKTDLDQQDDGNLTLPLLNSSVDMEIFTPRYAPRSTKITTSELSADVINVTLEQFSPGGAGAGGQRFSDLTISMLISNSSCNVPYPSSNCTLSSSEIGNFNPLGVVMSGGEISLRMRKQSNGVTVHYNDVDLLASGPPDAQFDDSGSNTVQNQSLIEQIWRFGSSGPEIYDSILVGVPYSDSEINDSSNITVNIDKLYDEDWGVIWNSTNTTEQLQLLGYGAFDQQWFNTTTSGVLCNATNVSALCYINTSDNKIWLQFPHFSGLGPELRGDPPGEPPTQLYNITLSQGWNLISIPLEQYTPEPG